MEANIHMNTDFINLTTENLADEHLCCIIRSKKFHPGIDAKRQWLSDRLKEGHVFRKLNEKATIFIEYAPLETAWVPIIGDNYYYIYCLWVTGNAKGNGYGKSLMEYCLADAKEKGKSGACMLGSKNKNHGFPTSPLRRSSVLKWLILLKMDMNCLHFLLTEQRRDSHNMLKSKKLKVKS